MKLGFGLPIAGAWADPGNQRAVARRADELGYASLWCFQRLLVPREPRDDYPPLPGQPWPAAFEFALDPTTSLAHVAAVTERIRLGFAVLNVPFYSPALLAKQIATLDYLSDGRVDLGLGLGWSRDEFAAVGVPFTDRGARMDEFIDCLRAIWTQEYARFDGTHYHVPGARIDPPPRQTPHPPILVGGYGKPAIRRTIARGDGFVGGNVHFDDIEWIVREIREGAAAAGRDPGDLAFVCRGAVRVHAEAQGSARRPLWGSHDEVREDLQRYADAGVTELFLDCNLDPAVGGADADAQPAVERGWDVLETFAPSRLGRYDEGEG